MHRSPTAFAHIPARSITAPGSCAASSLSARLPPPRAVFPFRQRRAHRGRRRQPMAPASATIPPEIAGRNGCPKHHQRLRAHSTRRVLRLVMLIMLVPCGLATSLNNLAKFLSDLGQREEALQAAQEAVAMRRELAAQRPDAFRPDLATSLNNLANFLSELGQREEALQAAEEAVTLLSAYFLAQPGAFGQWMAVCLRNYLTYAERVGIQPDVQLISPIIEVFNRAPPER